MSRNVAESNSDDRVRMFSVNERDHNLRTNFMSFCARVTTILRDPTQLPPIFLDYCSLLHSLWEKRRSGPNFIAPMSSLTMRPSGRLSRILLQHSRALLNYESDDMLFPQESNPQTVAVIHLSKTQQEGVKADLHGLVSLPVLILALISVFLPSSSNNVIAFETILLFCAGATVTGDGNLTLVRRSEEIHDTSTPASDSCVVLLSEDLTVVVKGPEVVVEAIANDGFHLVSHWPEYVLNLLAWKVAPNAIPGDIFQGLLCSAVFLSIQLLGRLPLTPLLATLLGLPLTIPSWETSGETLWTVFRLLRGPSITATKRIKAMRTIVTDPSKLMAMGIPLGGFLLLCMYTSDMPRLQDLVQLVLLLNLLPLMALAFIHSISPQNYPLRAAKLLDVLGNPPVKKWRFKTPVATAIFQRLLYSMALLLTRFLGRPPLTPLLAILLILPLTVPFRKTTWFQFYHVPAAGNRIEPSNMEVMEGFRVVMRLMTFFVFSTVRKGTSLWDFVQPLLILFPSASIIIILSISYQDYPLQTAKVLDVLGNPPVTTWRFDTLAAAATFQCLIMCDGLVRPTKGIDVRGVLDTIIPDQRSIWDAWKARVADRITHEVDAISFTPTLPTFRDKRHQMQLKEYLDEAQYAYERYRHVYPSNS